MPILRQIYFASRAQEMAFFPLSEQQKQQFLESQFSAQHAHYQTYFKQAQFDCILQDGQVIGRLYVYRGAEEMRIVDINLLPAHCNQGIGTALLQQLIAEAEQKQISVSAHVEYSNPARRLYARLGFTEVEERGVYIFVVKSAHTASQAITSHIQTKARRANNATENATENATKATNTLNIANTTHT